MLALMFLMRWDFALIALAVTPFLLFFVSRVRKAVKKATHEVRRRQAEIISTVQQGLEAVRVVQAYEREDLQEAELSRVGKQTIEAALRARRIKALLAPTVAIVVALCTGLVLWRGTSLVLGRCHAGRHPHCLPVVYGHVLQAGTGPRHHDQRDRPDVGGSGAGPGNS